MKLILGDNTELDISGYNECLEESLIQAFKNDNADAAAKVIHLMLCDAGMTGNPKPDLLEHYVDEVEQEANKKNPQGAVFLDATGKPKSKHKQDFDYPLGLLDEVRKYLGLGDWNDPNNLVKHDEFFLSTLYTKFGYDITEEAIDYLGG